MNYLHIILLVYLLGVLFSGILLASYDDGGIRHPFDITEVLIYSYFWPIALPILIIKSINRR